MIRIEDLSVEEDFFENQPRVFVPFSIKQDLNATAITAIPSFESVAIEVEKRYLSDPFSRESLDFIDQGLRKEVTDWGYRPDRRVNSYILNFEPFSFETSKIQDSTRMLKGKGELVNLTGGVIEEYEDFVDEVYFATVIDGKIVSICGINCFGEDGATAEINIRTAPEYRGKGYATSNVVAMTEYLTKIGYRVAYNASVNNLGSIAVAKKSGFEIASKSYYYICYREE